MKGHRTGTVDDRKEDKTEEIATSRRSHLSKNRVDQVTGDTDNTFRGSNVWGNDSALLSAPHTIGIPGGAVATTTQLAMTFEGGGGATHPQQGQ